MMESNLKKGHFGCVFLESIELLKQARDRLGTTDMELLGCTFSPGLMLLGIN